MAVEKQNKILKYLIKSLLTLILIVGSLFCFTMQKKEIVQKEIQVSEKLKRTTIQEDDGLKKYLEYVGLFLLLLAAWQWRNEIGFDSLGGMSKQPDVKSTDPDCRNNSEGDAPSDRTPPVTPSTDFTNGDDEFERFQLNEKLTSILELMSQNPNSITNASIIANKLGITRQTAERYLFLLMKNKLIRKDTYPGSRTSVYSLNNSLDNLAVDYFISNYLQSEEVYADYRFVRLKSRYEIDALIKTSKTNYIVETKFLRQVSMSILNKGIQQLLHLEEEMNLEPISLILLVVGSEESISSIDLEKLSIKENLKIHLIDKDKITTPNTQ